MGELVGDACGLRLSVQPDAQYIVNPGGTGTIQNSWILGGQVTVNF